MKKALPREGWLCALALAAIIAVLLHAALFTGKGLVPADGILRLPPWSAVSPRPVSNYMLSDQYMTFLPLRHFFHESFKAGRLGFWNPFLCCGVPGLAMIQAAPLFPLNLIFVWLDPFLAAAPIAFLKLLVAGVFTMLYLRRLAASWTAALYSATCFCLSGFMIVWLGHPHVNSACLLPALFYFLERGLSERGPRPWIGFAAIYGCAWLGGHPPTVVQISLAALAYFWFRRGTRTPWLPATLAAAGGLLIAAPQLLPYLEYWAVSSTSESSRTMERWAYHLPLSTIVHFFMPLISGSPARRFESLGVAFGITGGPYDNFNERTGYVGVLTLFLAAAGLLCRRDRLVKFYAVSALICFYFIWGLPPAPQLLRLLPLLNHINPTRLLLFVGFGLAVLGGLGLDELSRFKKHPRAPLLLASFGAAILMLVFWIWLAFRPLIPEMTASERFYLARQFPVFVAATLVSAIAAALAPTGKTKLLCLGWISFELLSYGRDYNPAVARSVYYPETPAIRFLRDTASASRTLGIDWTLAPNTGILYGLQDARGQDFTTVKRYEELITGGSGQFFFYTQPGALPPSFASLGVKYVLAPNDWAPPPGLVRDYAGEISIYRAPRALERASLLFDYQVLSRDEALTRARDPGFDPRRTLLLEETPAIASAPVPQDAWARVVSYEPEEVRVEASAGRAGLLLLADTNYPGWKAEVNGRAARIFQANYNFRAVEIPAGSSSVRFYYRPWSFYAGLALALATLAVMIRIFYTSKR